MKILMLVNWRVEKKSFNTRNLQEPDFFNGKEYWFFKNNLSCEDEIDVIGLETCSFISKIEYKLFKVYIFQTIKNLFKFKKYDIVISHGANSGIVLAFIRRLIKTKYKHVLFDIGSFRSGSHKNGPIDKIIKYASKSIDYVFYHSSGQFQYYKKEFPWLLNKSEFVKFGIDLEYFNKMKKCEKKFDGICIGSSFRDWETFFKAVDCSELSNHKFLVLGRDKEYFNKLNVPSNILFMNKVSSNRMIELINLSKISIIPLKSFEFSYAQMTFLDQGYLGIPIIAGKTMSLVDYGVDGKTCLFYQPEDFFDLRKKIQLLLNSEALRKELADNNRKYILKECDQQLMGKIVCLKLRQLVKDETI